MKLDLAPEVCGPLEREADREGTTLEKYCQAVLVREARRLEYIERSRPRTIEGQVGGPSPLLKRLKRAKELGKVLVEVYERLRVQQEGQLTPEQESQLVTIRAAMKTGDADTLEEFERDQPWRKKW